MTLNQIIAKFRTQAESHKMVGKFEVGQDFDFSVEEVKYYPLVWLIPNGFQFDSENKLVTYLFTLIIEPVSSITSMALSGKNLSVIYFADNSMAVLIASGENSTLWYVS